MKKLLFSFLLLVSSAMFVFSEVALEGTCGNNVRWTLYSDSLLVVSGSGPIYDYQPGYSPLSKWSNFATKVVIEEGVTYIGSCTFFNCSFREIEIASSVDSIGKMAFKKCFKLNSVKFDADSLERVNEQAFNETAWLDNQTVDLLYIGKTLYSVGNKFDKNIFTNINVKEGTKYINNGALFNCPNLKTVSLPSSLIKIGSSAFRKCFNIREINVAAVVPPVVDKSTFDGVRWDIKLSVPKGSEDAYKNAATWSMFYERHVSGTFGDNISWEINPDGIINITGSGDMPDIKWPDLAPWDAYSYNINSVVIGEGITSVGKMAFDFFTSVREVSLPSTLKEIRDFAFRNCSLSELRIPEGVTSIKYTAFGDNNKLEKVFLPSTITEIGDYAFENCTNITIFYLYAKNPPAIFDTSLPVTLTGVVKVPIEYEMAYRNDPVWKSYFFQFGDDEIVFSGTCGENLNWSVDTAKHVLNISGTGKMFNYLNSTDHNKITAPWGNFNFYNLNIEEGITHIGNNAFCRKSLKTVELPASLKSIGNDAFYGCAQLRKVVIPDNVDSIGDRSFTFCLAIDSLILGSNVSFIDNLAFAFTNINYIDMHGATPPDVKGNPFDGININDVTMNVPEGSEKAYSEHDYWGIIYKKITNGKFSDNIYWSFHDSIFTFFGSGKIEFPYINQRPWDDFADKVKYLVFDDGITEIGDNFTNHISISEVRFPESLRSIGVNAFKNQNNIKEITLPENLQKIGNNAFAYCSGISEPVVLSENLTSLGDSVFAFCSNLTDVTLNTKIKVLNSGLFSNTNIDEIVIPEGVTAINDKVFEKCSNLRKIVLPSTLEKMGLFCITNNNKLDSVFSNAVVPPVLNAETFIDINFENIVVVVPEGSIDAYKADEYWKVFNIVNIKPEPEPQPEPEPDPDPEPDPEPNPDPEPDPDPNPDPEPTDVENIQNDLPAAYSYAGELVINSDYDYVIFNASGSVVRRGQGSAVITDLSRGIYFIRINGHTHKVAL